LNAVHIGKWLIMAVFPGTAAACHVSKQMPQDHGWNERSPDVLQTHSDHIRVKHNCLPMQRLAWIIPSTLQGKQGHVLFLALLDNDNSCIIAAL